MSQGIPDFLAATGGTGLLVALYESDHTFSELLERVDATSSTLSTRLTDAEELGLITTETGKRDGNRAKEYQLIDFGSLLTMTLDRQGVVEHYRQFMYHKASVDEGRRRVVEWVSENEQQLLVYQSELEQSGSEYFEELREQVFDTDLDSDTDNALDSETVDSSGESNTESGFSSADGTADTENDGDDDNEADDEERDEITGYWGSLDPDTGSISDDDSGAGSTEN